MVQVLPPAKLAHIVLRSNNYEPMVDFYEKFLGAKIQQKSPMGAFMTYDEEHHRIAILNMPHLSKKDRLSNGLEHMAFTYSTVKDLLTAYKQRLELGYKPVWTINHGATLSFYYQDPDGNNIEIQVDAMTSDEANDFVRSKAFDVNPIGVDVDPEDFIRGVEAGEDEKNLLKRPGIGPRDPFTVPRAIAG